MTVGDIVKKAPNALIWAVTVAFVAIVAAFVVLAATGSNTADLRSFLNLVLNIVGALFGGGALVTAGAAARSSAKAEEQTNGVLDQRIADGVRQALVTKNVPPVE